MAQAVSRMDQVTQQNAALIEESAVASERLKQQAGQSVEAVSVFKTGDQAADAEAVASSRPERRSANRATNVVRPTFGARSAAPVATEPSVPPVPVHTGIDQWKSV